MLITKSVRTQIAMKAATFSAAAQNAEYSSPTYFSADDLSNAMTDSPAFLVHAKAYNPISPKSVIKRTSQPFR
jgi:hypothetical protein